MGILWTVRPLDDQMKSWLDQIGVEYPRVASRFPTGHEIKTVVTTLPGHHVTINDNGIGRSWQADIVAKSATNPCEHGTEWALLHITKYSGDTLEQKLWFERGWESVITRVLKELAKNSGPLVLMDDAGGDPIVISAAA
jgi:hypothetical protein